MNSVKLDTKLIFGNQLHFYTPIINSQKEKLRKQSHIQLHQENKIPRNKFNQEGKQPMFKKP